MARDVTREDFKGLDEFFAYKNQFMDDLMGSKKIRRLLDDDFTRIRAPGELIYHQVFPYEYVPETTEHATTFICCEVDISRVTDKLYLTPDMYVYIFTHKSLVRLPEGGLRIDELSSEITKILSGSRMYGLGELNIYSAKHFAPIANYQGRILIFRSRDINRFNPTGKTIPVNRKSG